MHSNKHYLSQSRKKTEHRYSNASSLYKRFDPVYIYTWYFYNVHTVFGLRSNRCLPLIVSCSSLRRAPQKNNTQQKKIEDGWHPSMKLHHSFLEYDQG